MQDEIRRFDRKGAAAFLREHGFPVAPSTLAKLATLGRGPRYVLFGRRPLYEAAELLAWAEARIRGPFANTTDAEAQTADASPAEA